MWSIYREHTLAKPKMEWVFGKYLVNKSPRVDGQPSAGRTGKGRILPIAFFGHNVLDTDVPACVPVYASGNAGLRARHGSAVPLLPVRPVSRSKSTLNLLGPEPF